MPAKKNIKPPLIFLLVALLILALWYGIKSHPLQQQSIIGQDSYHISKPNQGTLFQKQNITVEYLQNDEATAIVTETASNKIHPHQDIILYDKAGATMPLGGKIKTIIPRGDHSKIIIALPKGAKTGHLSNKVDIITLEAPVSLRFPLSALQQDKNGNHYAWSAKKTEKDGEFLAEKIWLEAPLIGENSFVAGSPIGVKTLLISNPDKKIKNKTTYKTAEINYDLPHYNPIKQAYYDYQAQQRKVRSMQAKQNLADCMARSLEGKLTDSSPPSSSCNSSAINEDATPMEIFNSILSRQPNSDASCSSCSSQ